MVSIISSEAAEQDPGKSRLSEDEEGYSGGIERASGQKARISSFRRHHFITLCTRTVGFRLLL
jgi:hypothetical protein